MKILKIYETVKINLEIYVTKCKETSKLKTENLSLLEKTMIWSKIYGVVKHTVKMGVVEI